MDGQVFRDAIQLLETEGWCKGEARNPAGEMCARGVLCYAVGSHPDKNGWVANPDVYDTWLNAVAEVTRVALEQYPDRYHNNSVGWSEMSVWVFNDHPDTTLADVTRVFEKAAVAWDEKL